MHTDPHPQAGETVSVTLKHPIVMGNDQGAERLESFRIENWANLLYEKSWMFADGSIAAMAYGMRAGFASLPIDDEVVYGQNVLSGMSHLVHVSEIDTEA